MQVRNTVDGCKSIRVPVALTENALPTVTISGTASDCPSSVVELTATVTGGTSPYTYAWTEAEGTTNKASVTFPTTCTTKNVSVKVTDNNNCVGSGNYTLEAVAEKPTIQTGLENKNFGCSTFVEPKLSDFIVTDKCAPATSTPQVTLTSSEVSTTNCEKSQTWTATYDGVCESAEEVKITYTWTEDSEEPTIGTIETTINLESTNCVFTVPDLKDKVLAVTTDNCTANSDLVYNQDLTVGEEITADKILNVTVTDACGNKTTIEFTLKIPAYPSLSYKSEDVACSDDKTYYTAIISANTGTLTVTSGNASVSENTDGTWTLTSTNKSNSSIKLTTVYGCTTTLDIIAPDCSCPTIDAPEVSSNSYCLGATTLPALEADATLGTNEQIEWYDADTDGNLLETGISYTPTSAGIYYVQVRNIVDGCKSIRVPVTLTENARPVLDIQSVYELCPSDTLSAKTLSSLLPNVTGVTYKFYDEFDVEIADLYKTSTENYYVVGVSANGCESEKVSFAVDLAKNVDFTLTASQTSMLVGGNETVITIVPDADSDEADTYTWQANGNEIAVDGLEYSTNLYLDTKFEVTATNRCDSKSQEVSIEVLWPTAFTPHNDNGKNDDFAKGMPIIVFNRFYTKIFEGSDGWDGTINGTMNDSKNIAVPGVYYYKVDLPNGEVKKGTIEIVR